MRYTITVVVTDEHTLKTPVRYTSDAFATLFEAEGVARELHDRAMELARDFAATEIPA